MDLIVSPAVLIPRPETEHVIETVLELGSVDRNGGRGRLARQTTLRIADVGTGSGCIALALAKELPQAEIHASDVSAAALEVARANAARHQLESRIQFHEADLLAGSENDAFDFIVSNPPYVGESEEDQVQLEVRQIRAARCRVCGSDGSRGYNASDSAGPRRASDPVDGWSWKSAERFQTKCDNCCKIGTMFGSGRICNRFRAWCKHGNS